MKYHIEFIEYLMKKNGPEPSDYTLFTSWLKEVACEVRKGKLSRNDLQEIRAAFKNALSVETVQGFVLTKPHGYPGDYEIIEKIYNHEVSSNKELKNWDLYSQSRECSFALRNRKQYFIQLLKSLAAADNQQGPISILNIASGPARDILEFYEDSNDRRIFFDCIDHDADAIAYATKLCAKYEDNLTFYEANALKFNADKKYRIVWSAGLFDYLNGKKFLFLLAQLLNHLSPDGELIIGNFSCSNPNRDYFEIMGDWYLYHRDPEDLVLFAEQCGIRREDIYVGQEQKGINLFLHIKRGKNFTLPENPICCYP